MPSLPATENQSQDVLLDSLKQWLSVAESQLCALQVLGEQLPQMNRLLEENMMELSTSFSLLSSEAQAQITNVKEVVRAASSLHIDGEERPLAEEVAKLKKLAEKAGDKAVQKEIKRFSSAMEAQENALQKAQEVALISSDKMVGAISAAIVGMQFQDRVSQNLVIAKNVIGEIAIYADASIERTLQMLEEYGEEISGAKGVLDKEFARSLIAGLNLGELQNMFIDHLIKHGYIESGEQLGFKPTEQTKAGDEDDIELF